jgi:hypothetical protein
VSEGGGSRSRDSDPWATATREAGDPGYAPDAQGSRDTYDPRDAHDSRDAHDPREVRDPRDARGLHDAPDYRGIRDPYGSQGSRSGGSQSVGGSQSGGGSRSGSRGSGSRSGSSRGSDPVGDLQRWVVRNSAKTLGREIKGQFRSVTGGSKNKVDVWDVATTEPPPTGESPECAWCPICRAARRARQSGPGLTSQIAGVGDALLSVAQDAISAVDSTLSSRQPGTSPGRAAPASTGLHSTGSASTATAAAGTDWPSPGRSGTGWPGEGTAHTHHPATGPAHDSAAHDSAAHDNAAPDGPDDRA